jgi:hypothetical protein
MKIQHFVTTRVKEEHMAIFRRKTLHLLRSDRGCTRWWRIVLRRRDGRRSEARGGVIYVWGVKAIVCWRRVLRHERRWTTVWTTVRGGPASRLRLLDVGQIGPAVASPAKGEQAEYHDEENDEECEADQGTC